MPITVITGLPGHGKTLRMVSMIQEAAEKAERPIYVAGVDGLVDGPWSILDDPLKWDECPDGSLIFVDEAWKWFGHLQENRGAKNPPHVLALAEHRHKGIDFVWTTQAPAQLYPFARTLCAEHTHVVRKAGTGACELYTWPELQDDVKGSASRSRAHKTFWVHPKKLFEMYKSASLHTIKPKFPWAKIAILPVLLAALGACLWYAIDYVVTLDESETSIENEPKKLVGWDEVQVIEESRGLRAADPLAYIRPRIPGLPWTAPAYDEVPFGDPPRYWCYISHKLPESTCRCVTDQGTTYMLADSLCRSAAIEGVYDPVRRGSSEAKKGV